MCCTSIRKHLVSGMIDTCPNIEVDMHVTDKSPFFIRPYHIREEDKAFIDKEMKWLCYMGF